MALIARQCALVVHTNVNFIVMSFICMAENSAVTLSTAP